MDTQERKRSRRACQSRSPKSGTLGLCDFGWAFEFGKLRPWARSSLWIAREQH